MFCGEQRVIVDFPGRHRSAVWNHFGFYQAANKVDVDKRYAICRICYAQIKYSGNTTNMSNHLFQKHNYTTTSGDGRHPGRTPSLSQQYTSHALSATADNTAAAAVLTGDAVIKCEAPDGDYVDHEEQSPHNTTTTTAMPLNCIMNIHSKDTPSTPMTTSPREDPGGSGGNSSASKTESIVKYLIGDMVPLSTTKEPTFRDLIQALDSSYQMPTEAYFKQYVLAVLYRICEHKVKDLISKVNRFNVCPEVWTHIDTGTRYVTVWIHFIDTEWKYHSYVTDTVDISGGLGEEGEEEEEDIARAVQDVCDTWGIHDRVMTSPCYSGDRVGASSSGPQPAAVSVRCLGKCDYSRSRLRMRPTSIRGNMFFALHTVLYRVYASVVRIVSLL